MTSSNWRRYLEWRDSYSGPIIPNDMSWAAWQAAQGDKLPGDFYVVKHLQTGEFLPILLKGEGGYSWWDPTVEGYVKGGCPRIFKNKLAANSFIVQWARGRATKITHRGTYFDGYSHDNEVFERLGIEDVGRTRSMLRAIPVNLMEKRDGF
jgi:hypothetical protein